MKRCYQLKELQTFLSSDNLPGIAFAEKCGFTLARKSYTYEMTEENLKPSLSSETSKIIQLKDLTPAQLEEVIHLQYEDYQRNHHAINPLSADITFDEWRSLIMTDLAQEASYVLVAGRKVVAYLIAYEADATTIEVGYTGNKLQAIKDYEVFLSNVMIELFQKYKVIELEIDDCDSSANVLNDLFTYQPTVSWDTYVK